MKVNIDEQVVDGFGDEWSRFDQSELTATELTETFDAYFDIFPWETINADAVGFDAGCGSGRWARLVAPRVGKLHLIDPSEKALAVAKRNLRDAKNCDFHLAGVGEIPLPDNSCDFGYSLGVLHHIPDTEAGMRACIEKLRPGAPFLVYLYYRFDNRPAWFRLLYQVSNLVRKVISHMPHSLRYLISQIIAATIYFPLARIAWGLEKLGLKAESFPLWYYRNRSFYFMRTDALDRFGTRLEKRFTKAEIREMMENCGLENIVFNDTQFWTAVGTKK